MKSIFQLSLLVVALSLVACSRENDDTTNGNPNAPSGLEAFLDGRFNVEAIDFSGSVSGLGGLNAPIDSSGNGGSGFYNFNASTSRANFDVTGQIKFSILTQSFDVPIPVRGQGDFEVVSETRFTITPDGGGQTVVYDVKKAEDDILVCTTRTVQDTLSFTFDTTLELFLKKE
jgi:hypothetical protein